MFKRNLTTILRSLWRRKINTTIHLFGLAIGLASCIIVFLFVQHESSFDKHQPFYDRTYRVNAISTSETGSVFEGTSPFPVPKALRQDLPDLEKVTGINTVGTTTIRVIDKKYEQQDILFADADFVDIFKLNLLKGNAKVSLAQPNKVLLDQSTARKYFGEQEAIGQVIKYGNKTELEVAGVFSDIEENTHMPVSFLISMSTLTSELMMGFDLESWGFNSSGSCYVVLPENTSVQSINDQLAAISDKYYKQTEGSVNDQLVLQAMSDIHFNTQWVSNTRITPINRIYLWVFIIIGLAILFLACINFINLATVQAIQRGREVSVRKVLGASKSQLVLQYLGEAYLITFVAALMAILLTEISLPLLNQTLGQQLDLNILSNLPLLGIFLAVIATVGFLAGIYPAFVMAKFDPVAALKTQRTTGSGESIWMRRSLVTLQFVITFVLLICTLIISYQLDYCKNMDLGFKKEAILMIDIHDPKSVDALRSEWQRNADITGMSFSLGAPLSNNNFNLTYNKVNDEAKRNEANVKLADENYIEIFGLNLIAGRKLTAADASNASLQKAEEERRYVIIVNEVLVNEMGYSSPEEILGQKLRISMNKIEAEVVGVVKNFNTSSLHDAYESMILINFPHFYYTAGLKVNMSNLTESLAFLEKSWSKQFPDQIFNYTFLDENIEQLYQSENRLFNIFLLFAGLAILIGCLGLWGLVSFTTQQRTKEIGVRKILGASIADIILMLSREFTLLVLLAFLIAIPIAYYLGIQWLQNFSFAIKPGPKIFLFSLVLTLLIAWTTMSYQSIRAALHNPVNALRQD